MSKFQGTFKRVEKKYRITREQYEHLMMYIGDRMVLDKYGRSTICNIYFDTPKHQLIRTSLQKPVYKEKLRFRSYGVPNEDSTTFVELKKKFKGVVYKRRVAMTYTEAVDYLYNGKRPPQVTQITNEIDWTFKLYNNLRPAMFLSYDRVAYYNKEDSNLRITFDSNIIWREEELFLSKGVWGNKLLDDNTFIMEIKIPGAMPLWLADTLDTLGIFPSSFSKYGTAYKETQNKMDNKLKNEGGIICA